MTSRNYDRGCVFIRLAFLIIVEAYLVHGLTLCDPEDHKVFEAEPYPSQDYFECEGGILRKKACPENEVFDVVSGICDFEEIIGSRHKVLCRYNDELFAKDGSGCRQYYWCHNGHPLLQNCPLGQLFEEVSSECTHESFVRCRDRGGRNSNCKYPGDKYIKPHSGCRKYFICERGNVRESKCPSGQIFDETIKLCDWEELVQCRDYEDTKDKKCPLPNGSFLKPNSRCRKYYRCYNGKAREMDCPYDELFNEEAGQCEWKELVDCKSDGPKDPDCPKRNGKFLKDGTRCRSYVECREGKAKVKKCPRHKLFDENRQTCNWPDLVQCRESKSTTSIQSTKISTVKSTRPSTTMTSTAELTTLTTVKESKPSTIVTKKLTTIVTARPTTKMTARQTTKLTARPTTMVTVRPTVAPITATTPTVKTTKLHTKISTPVPVSTEPYASTSTPITSENTDSFSSTIRVTYEPTEMTTLNTPLITDIHKITTESDETTFAKTSFSKYLTKSETTVSSKLTKETRDVTTNTPVLTFTTESETKHRTRKTPPKPVTFIVTSVNKGITTEGDSTGPETTEVRSESVSKLNTTTAMGTTAEGTEVTSPTRIIRETRQTGIYTTEETTEVTSPTRIIRETRPTDMDTTAETTEITSPTNIIRETRPTGMDTTAETTEITSPTRIIRETRPTGMDTTAETTEITSPTRIIRETRPTGKRATTHSVTLEEVTQSQTRDFTSSSSVDEDNISKSTSGLVTEITTIPALSTTNVMPTTKRGCIVGDPNCKPDKVLCPERQGLFPHPDDPTIFLHCDHWKPYIKECPNGLHFDPAKKSCQWPSAGGKATTVEEETAPTDVATVTEEAIFVCPSQRGKFQHPKHCSLYYTCKDGIAQVKECPERTLFSEEYHFCYDETDVDCGERYRPGGEKVTPIPTEQPKTDDNKDCSKNDFSCIVDKSGRTIRCPESSGVFPYPGDASRFILCDSYQVFVQECAEKLSFDPKTKLCVRNKGVPKSNFL